jgi:chromosome partitioning protein
LKTLATYSIKGGVGKTTAAVNLADAAARAGARVLVWDLDPQGAATFFLRVRPHVKGGSGKLVGPKGALGGHLRASDLGGIDVLPADFSLRHLDVHLDDVDRPLDRLAELLSPLEDRYDVALLDCPPSISLASESVFGAAGALLVPTIPAPLSARTLTQLEQFLRTSTGAPEVLPFLSMVDRRKRLHHETETALRSEFPALATTVIPNASAVEQMGIHRAPISRFAPRGAPAKAFEALWAEIAGRLWAS